MSQAKPAIEARKVTRTFGTGPAKIEALRGVDLRIEAGEFVSVMGASGSGKSTLLNLLGGLDVPTSGDILFDGVELHRLSDDDLSLLRRRKVGFIFQAFNLIDVLSAEENVAMPLLIDALREAEAMSRARECLEMVGLGDRRRNLPGQLSGGEQQRVALARALVIQPLLLLADEPTGNLDSSNAQQVISLLRTLVDERGQTILMVTHDARQAAVADRLIRLRDGVIVEQQQLSTGKPLGEILGNL